MKLEGIFTALITPFLDGKLDIKSFRKLLKIQITEGISNFVLFGSTAEGGALSLEEELSILDIVSEFDDLNIIVNLFSNSAHNVLAKAKNFESYKIINAFMVVVPFYNNPTKKGVLEHFKYIAKNLSKPFFIYNVPSRVNFSLDQEMIYKLAEIENIIGIKDASGNMDNMIESNKFIQLGGNDAKFIEFQRNKGNGIISVSSHIIPKIFLQLYELCNKGSYDRAKETEDSLKTLHDILSIESNPIPVKYALYLLSIISSPEVRLPLISLSQEHRKEMKVVLEYYNILKNERTSI